MIEAMWIWGAIGILLLAVEMATGTFYVLWFGVAALCVAVIIGLLPHLSHALQFALFAILSLGSLAIWRRYYKKNLRRLPCRASARRRNWAYGHSHPSLQPKSCWCNSFYPRVNGQSRLGRRFN